MIHFLEGKIELKGEKFLILNSNGVGFQVFCSPNTLKKIPAAGENTRVFTRLHLKEDSAELYGFLSERELELFQILNEVSGIGPKAALLIASVGTIEQFKQAIQTGDSKFFEGIKGIGQKKVQKIILELTGKLKEWDRKIVEQKDEALEALIKLGFTAQKAKQALSQVPAEIRDTENRIKEALKFLGG